MIEEDHMTKSDEYREDLRKRGSWDEYLRKKSGLPGPRGNLELAQVVADEGDRELFERYLEFTPERAPENTPEVFLAFCGVVGIGRLAAEGNRQFLPLLRKLASDPRWRIREGVAMALQRLGDRDMEILLAEMEKWSHGGLLEQRAAAAALCEPRLLKDEQVAAKVLNMLDGITAGISKHTERKGDDFVALKKGLAYCWSVAVVAFPAYGKKLMEKWIASEDKDIRWIMKENLKKNRLVRSDANWTAKMLRKMG
jgi:hypothetical protein